MAMVTSSARPRDAGNASPETSEVSAERLQLTEIALQRNTQRAHRARWARDEAAASGTLVWDPFDPAWRTDPYRVYAWLRENNPAHRSPLGFWVFTRHADCLPILRDRRWSSDSRNMDAAQRPGLQDMDLVQGNALSEMLAEMALMEHPDQLARFRDDPAVLRSGIEEMLRFVSPVQLTSRIALEDMEVAGITLRKGDYAMLLIGSANRDPAVFTEPGTFDVGRAENPHLGFGYGIHNCLGAPLAKLEAQIALGALLRRARQLERTSEPLAYKQSIALRGLATLPVTLSAR
jgi:cytochrome P450